MESKDAKLLNGLALAYIGDAIYELEIRRYLLEIGETKPQHLHRLATQYVSARGQAKSIKYFQDEGLLTGEELDYFKRGRNSKINTKAKNTDIHRYLQATGFEALMGYLYLTKQEERLEELIKESIQYIDEEEGRK